MPTNPAIIAAEQILLAQDPDAMKWRTWENDVLRLSELIDAETGLPKLLEALQALTATARTFRNVPKDEQEWTSIDDDALEAAFAALAAAEGEEPDHE